MTQSSTTRARKSRSLFNGSYAPSEQTLRLLQQYAASVSVSEDPSGRIMGVVLN